MLLIKVLIKEMTRSENAKTAPFVAEKGGSPYYNFDTGIYQEGILRGEGLLDGKVVCTDVVQTPVVADHLEIEMADRGVTPVADASDMVPFYVKVCDKNGTILSNKKALETYKINLKVSGKGALIGANVPRIEIASQQSEGRIGYGIIRTTKQAGTIEVNASSPGLKSGKTIIKTRPYSGEYVPDGDHSKWEDEVEAKEIQTVSNNAKAEVLSEVIKLSVDKIVLSGNNDRKR